MLLDAATFDKQTIPADLCIIGAGAAGISLACALIDSGLSVLVLEAGRLDFDADTQSLYHGENVSFNHFPLEHTRLRYFGGTTNHWNGMCARFTAFDLAPRPGIPHTGWPLSAETLAAYYPAAEHVCQLGRVAWDDLTGWQHAAGFPALPPMPATIMPGIAHWSPPSRFGEVYRDTLARAANVRVLLGANVQELIADDRAAHVERAEVKCLGGPRCTITAKRFVLALGGMETTRLLLLSQRQQPAGLGNGSGLVGRFYTDHPGIDGLELRLMPSAAPAMRFFLDRIDVGNTGLCGIFQPATALLEQEGLGNHRFTFSTGGEVPPGIDSVRALANVGSDAEARTEVGRHLGNVLADIEDVANLAYKNVAGTKAGPFPTHTGPQSLQVAVCHISAEQFPNPDSRLTLSSERDLFGQPRIRLDWRLQDRDMHTMRRGLTLFGRALATAGIGRLHLPRELAGDFRFLVDYAAHPMGTTRMSADPRQGIVDPDLKVHGIDNLFVASSSVFPTGSWYNPTLTIVALALRLADHLKETPP